MNNFVFNTVEGQWGRWVVCYFGFVLTAGQLGGHMQYMLAFYFYIIYKIMFEPIEPSHFSMVLLII